MLIRDNLEKLTHNLKVVGSNPTPQPTSVYHVAENYKEFSAT